MVSHLETAFLTLWERFGNGSAPLTEVYFHLERDWRFDFAWPARLVAVEIEGGTFTRGRHSRGSGYADDCRKYNAAVRLGWRVVRYTADMLDSDPLGAVGDVAALLESAAFAVTEARLIVMARNVRIGDEMSAGFCAVARPTARRYVARYGTISRAFASGRGATIADARRGVVDFLMMRGPVTTTREQAA